MNENIINLVIRAKNLSQGALNQVKGQLAGLERASESAGSTFESMAGTFRKSVAAVAIVGGILGGFGAMALSSASQVETMSVALETSFQGNVEQAKAAQKAITEFAAKTPYDLNQVMTGFIKLKNMGLDPSEKAMVSYGNTASAMGKSLNDMVEAVADAATGEFERLKEFGIKAKSEGDKVTFTFKGVATTVGKNSAEIEQYLIKLGETNFAGGMEKQSQTLAGKISTLKDVFSQTMSTFANDSGLLEFAKKAVDSATMLMSGITPAMEQLKEFGELVKLVFGGGVIFEDQIPIFIFDIAEALGGIEARRGVLGIVWQLIDSFRWLKNESGLLNPILFGVAGVIGTFLVSSLVSLALSATAAALPFLALGSLFAGLYLLFQNQDTIVRVLSWQWSQFTSKMGEFVSFLASIFGPEIQTLNSIWNNFVEIMKTVWSNLQPLIAIFYALATQALAAVIYAFNELRQPLNDFIQAIFNIARPIIDILAPAFVYIVGMIATLLIPTFQLVWAIVVQVFKGILETITGVINIIAGILNVFIGVIKGIFTGDFSQAADGFKQIWQGLVQFLQGIIDFILAPVRGIIDGIWNIVTGIDLAAAGVNMMNGFINSIWGAKDGIMGAVGNIASSITNSFSNAAQSAWNSVANLKVPNFGGTPVSGKGRAWAKGGAFENGNVVAFADGGVVSRPTNFPMAGGQMGLMGEAGPEAIMPLTRGSDGKLGVKAQGGSQGITINLNGTFLGSERDRLEFVKMIKDSLQKELKLA